MYVKMLVVNDKYATEFLPSFFFFDQQNKEVVM